MKLCRVCRRIKPEEDFYPTPSGTRDVCKTCFSNQMQGVKRNAGGHKFTDLGIAKDRNPNGAKNSLRSRILELPYGHPLKNKYFENKKVYAEYHRYLERWARDGSVARPGASSGR